MPEFSNDIHQRVPISGAGNVGKASEHIRHCPPANQTSVATVFPRAPVKRGENFG